jgi:integrase
MRINNTEINKLTIPADKPVFYRDDEIKGFGVKVFTSGAISFFLEKKINGKGKRITIGRYGELTAEQARKQAVKLAGQIASGGDPIAERKEKELKGVTLGQAFADYLATRKDLKPKTLKDYNRVISTAFEDWNNKPLLSITKDMIAKRHTKLGEENGEAWANLSMRVLRALFNFAIGKYEDSQGRSLVPENPVKRLSQTRAWYKVDKRKGHVKPGQLAAWFRGVLALPNETLRDYLQLLILTGLRRNEAAKLEWANVDMNAKTFTIIDPKNHNDHTLPMSDYLFDMLARRKAAAVNGYVFPGTGTGGFIVEPRKQMAKVTKASGVEFTVHDLRRSFISIAERLDIPAYSLKKLLNHSGSKDVTGDYIQIDEERLREPMQKITDYVLRMAELKATAEVISLEQKRQHG